MTRSETREILDPVDYVDRHKKAFRDAFNFLNDHFPPEDTDEYWKNTSDEVSLMTEKDDNPLLLELLVGIVSYLSDESVLRRNNDDGG